MFRNFPVAACSEEEGRLPELTLYCRVLEQLCLDKPASLWSCSGTAEAKTKGFFLLGIFCNFKIVVLRILISLERIGRISDAASAG